MQRGSNQLLPRQSPCRRGLHACTIITGSIVLTDAIGVAPESVLAQSHPCFVLDVRHRGDDRPLS